MAIDKACAKLKKSYEKVPMVKNMIAGNFLDLVRRGHIKMDV